MCICMYTWESETSSPFFPTWPLFCLDVTEGKPFTAHPYASEGGSKKIVKKKRTKREKGSRAIYWLFDLTPPLTVSSPFLSTLGSNSMSSFVSISDDASIHAEYT